MNRFKYEKWSLFYMEIFNWFKKKKKKKPFFEVEDPENYEVHKDSDIPVTEKKSKPKNVKN